ncbi:hypothetical protein ZOD2009_11750 [Haladaptatus paucihalophilus DX253]|uniref:Uncharacterized protein n=1 Tax=Haladaptatus paucihalophilus DX253 TaxID=797209 RepID=E7QU70_HALPU|nr:MULTISPECIES: hypothetical protein [Haladaptatus]EFW92149.1 hypothetical protein ZOD2009_11750 [Haladaptatus paucihalophilus DX253]GKZ14304.1 hypothetical protein HAL_21850 [Haladaptatus sp. T7]SHK90169.1 hypothetical protein SAMN05444342_2559 [Haladaptatus paucihalophilus DX253]
MKLGILDTVSLAATLVLALPIALLGIDRIIAGEAALGGAFVAIGVLMVLLREKLTTPSDVPTSAAQKVVGKVAKTDDDEE